MAAKSVGFRLFPGGGGEGIRQRPCPLRHGLRRATSPKVGGKGCSAAFLALPLGELSAKQTERACFSVSGLALSVIPSGCHLPRSGRQGLLRNVLGSPFGKDSPGRGGVARQCQKGSGRAKQTERASLPFPPAALPSPSTPFGVATSPEVRGKSCSATFLAPTLGELSPLCD